MFMESNRLIEAQRRVVTFHDPEMESPYSKLAGCIFQKSHRLLAPAAATIFLTEVDLIDESIPSEPFEAVPEAQDRITNWRDFIQDEPSTAKGRVSEQRFESGTSLLSIVTIAVQGIKCFHEVEQEFDVVGLRDSK